MNKRVKKYREGTVFTNKYRDTVIVDTYIDCYNVMIKFTDGFIKKVSWTNLVNGQFKSPFSRSVCGVGYLGEGLFGKHSCEYTLWENMLRRCYVKGEGISQYKHTTVCEEWLNLQTFAIWCRENNYDVSEEVQLDKDLFSNTRSMYSPETCCFLPRELNTFIRRALVSRPRRLPVGVMKNGKRFCCQITFNKVKRYSECYDTPEEAFKVYKRWKEEDLKSLLLKYRDNLSEGVLTLLREYKVSSDGLWNKGVRQC